MKHFKKNLQFKIIKIITCMRLITNKVQIYLDNCEIYLDNCENKKFNNILLTRALVKRTVMTIPYNVTLHGCMG